MSGAPPLVDVLILGAGPAGLSAAAGLSRQLHTAIVFSSSRFRNERACHMHNVPGWDHKDPAEFRAVSREQILARYKTIRFEDCEIVRVAKVVGDKGKPLLLFEAVDVSGRKFQGRRVVVASGVRDIMPDDITGYEELWGRSIFHCAFCHGYEERGRPSAGLLATGALTNPMMGPAMARMAGQLAGQVTVYTNGNPQVGMQLRDALKSTKKFHIEDRKIASLAKDPETPAPVPSTSTPAAPLGHEEDDAHHSLLVTLEDGTLIREGFMLHAPDTEQAAPFAAQLGLELDPKGGFVKVASPFPTTSVEGVLAVGDCAAMLKSVPTAIYMGSTAAAGVVHSLQAEDDVEE
ncbi:pyridine nucleotide-disulfide oxidoreductase [Apiospora saccharicola]|uniref:Pyridine nucleotide-disulfide oxidoreductase n=1 Tax=Apiospora saccharicola TaxID=335842 RepID=A0ABR1UJN2_9PEZI